MRQRTKLMIYSGLIGAGVIGVLFAGYAVYSVNHLNKTRSALIQQYETEIIQLKDERISTTVAGWTTKTKITAGHKIREGDLTSVEMPKDSVPQDWITSKKDIAGKVAKVSLGANTLLTQTLLFEEEAATDDLRYRDMGFVDLPGTLAINDVVDIRIQFPTGQDYILLSKKKIQRLSSGVMTITINEGEILSLSSAIVDAYLHKASIYALLYVEPYLQSKAIPTYPVNQAVLDLIKRDPNIVNMAEQALQLSSRPDLESGLSVLSPDKVVNYAAQQANEVNKADSMEIEESFVMFK
ncbi:SAF domain-containing protein [Fontibacillus panacisegetis]|nr:SAF domain-containing protein [Fontibacillus solani]